MNFKQKITEIIENKRKEPIIFHKKPKIRKNLKQIISPYYPNQLLKKFLRWLHLRNIDGKLLVKEETDVNKIIAKWLKNSIMWVIEIFISGLLIQLAILPWFNPGLKIPFYSISFGLCVYVFFKIYEHLIDGMCRVARSIKLK